MDKNHEAVGETGSAPGDIVGYEAAAELLGIPINTLYGWVHAKRVPHIRLGSRSVRFSRRRLLAHLAAHAVEVAP